jgi:hypothetical protein
VCVCVCVCVCVLCDMCVHRILGWCIYRVWITLGFWGMSAYGKVQWPIDTSEPVVQVVSGGCPSATRLARVSARLLPSEWLWALILPRWVRMPNSQRVLRACVMEMSVSR